MLREWLETPAVAAALNGVRSHRQDRFLAHLLEGAQEFIEDEDERLAAAWAYVTGRTNWDKEKPVVRELFDVLHCLAAEQGTAGGPNVRLSCRLAADMVYARTGHRHALKTICWAGHRLVKLGALARTVRSRRIATVYHLLTDTLRAALAALRKQTLPPEVGLVSKGEEQQRPGFSAEDRAVFQRTVKLLRDWCHEFRWRPLWEREAPPPLLDNDGPMPWEEN